jgi:hypothetical protein
MLIGLFRDAETVAVGSGDAVGSSRSSSSSSSNQAAASAALLAVVFARSFVQLVDALEAVGPEVYFKSLLGSPVFQMRWVDDPAAADATHSTEQLLPWGTEDQHIAEVQWQVWQLAVLKVAHNLWAAFKSVGIAPSVAAASEAPAGDAAAEHQDRNTSSSIGSTSNSNSSSGGQQVKWGYLLRLQQCSAQWATAVVAYEANRPSWEEVRAEAPPSTAAAAEQLSQRYAAVLGVCRALAAAAPLAVVCNNPDCGNMGGVSEAAAATKACAGCRCRYCSVACQRADWKRHKRACREMAAAGQACV